jgi:hypothetical protein
MYDMLGTGLFDGQFRRYTRSTSLVSTMTIISWAAVTAVHNIVSVIGLITCGEIMSYRSSLSTKKNGCCSNRVVLARVDDKIIEIEIVRLDILYR